LRRGYVTDKRFAAPAWGGQRVTNDIEFCFARIGKHPIDKIIVLVESVECRLEQL